MLIDTHCHLNANQFKDTVDQVIKRAYENDVKIIICVGFDKQTNKKAIELAEQYDHIYATVGFHPTDAKDIKESDFVLLRKQLAHPKVVGVGNAD